MRNHTVSKIKGALAVRVILLVALFGASCFSCSERAGEVDDVLLARVYNYRLYQRDIAELVPPGVSSTDSLAMMQRYVDRWVRQHVFLHQALQNLLDEQMDFEKKIEDYRNSLLIFTFENELVRQRLDTLVTEQQIIDYYEANQSNFKLRENIVKVIYVKVPLDAPEVWRLRRLYRADSEEDMALLEEYSIQHAATYYIDTDSWLFFQDLLREIPINAPNQEAWLRSNRYIELTDNYFRYFLNIVDYSVRGSISPLLLERDNVKNILLNIRRHAFINEQRDFFLQEAIKDGRLELFI